MLSKPVKNCEQSQHKTASDCAEAMEDIKGKGFNYSALENRLPLSCPMQQLKFLIIRIRGKTKAAVKDPETFNIFTSFIEEHWEFILMHLSLRWKVSLLECYADQGDDLERGAALVLSGLIIMERGNQRLHYFTSGGGVFFKGLKYLSLKSKRADVHINFARRLNNLFINSPLLKALSLEIIEDMFDMPNSVLNQMTKGNVRNFKQDILGELNED